MLKPLSSGTGVTDPLTINTINVGNISVTQTATINYLYATNSNIGTDLTAVSLTVSQLKTNLNTVSLTVQNLVTAMFTATTSLNSIYPIVQGSNITVTGLGKVFGATVTISSSGGSTDPLIISNLSVTVTATINYLNVTNSNILNHVSIYPDCYISVTQGTWQWLMDTLSPYCGRFSNQVGSANGDRINYTIGFAKGTYTFNILSWSNANWGILEVLIDGVSKGTVDQYSAALNRQVRYSIAGIAITSGSHQVSIKVNGKNASSSDYIIGYNAMSFSRTGD